MVTLAPEEGIALGCFFVFLIVLALSCVDEFR